MIHALAGIVVRFTINRNAKYGDDLSLRNLNGSLNMIPFLDFRILNVRE